MSVALLLMAIQFPPADRGLYADHSHSEREIEAAYLFNFLKFVEWPGKVSAGPDGMWVIGIAGDSAVGGELARLVQGKNVEGRELLVKKVQAPGDLRACNILFISASEEKHLQSILAALQWSSVLTVADFDNFIAHGGMIQFVEDRDRVRMDIDLGATTRAGLKISSKLLALAQAVTDTVRSARNGYAMDK